MEVEEHSLGDNGKPENYKAALSDPEFAKWLVAMNAEIQSMYDNKVWKLVPLPPNAKVVKSKWIYKKKTDMDGVVYIYKARLVAKGFTQTYGVDYEETFSPVADIRAIRILLAIAAYYDYEIWQMDIKTAFLNGYLEEEIYMEQPEGYVAPGQESKVCKLVKSLYGLKEAPKQWHQKFDHVMMESGYQINECDKCVYVKNTSDGYVILCLYVDDMLIVGSNDKMIQSTKNMLNARFDMKDMGLADVILGVKITRAENGLTLSQTHYVDKILEKFNSGDSSIARTPIDTSHHLSKNRGEGVEQMEYARIIGSLMYLMSCTRPDLAFAISRLSRYTSNPSAEHWKSITRVLRYLRYTRTYGLHYTRYPAVIEGYTDANWISDIRDSK